MSILNRPNDGQFNLIAVLYRCLLGGGMKRERLLDLCAPSSAVTERKATRVSLNSATELGLFQLHGDDVALASGVSRDAPLEDTLRELVLNGANNLDLWAREKSRAADFTRAVCWILAQDVLGLRGKNFDSVNLLEIEQFGDTPIFANNSVLWDGFRPLARHLGFGWGWGGKFQADPTVAVEAALPGVFGSVGVELHQKEFLRKVADALPVLDGGVYRLEVERRLREGNQWRGPDRGHLSLSLSLALKRLEAGGRLALKKKDDDPEGLARLSGRPGRTLGSFTHVTYLGSR